MNNIKITSFPKNINPTDKFEEVCFKKFGRCPFCGNHEKYSKKVNPAKEGVETNWRYDDSFLRVKIVFYYHCRQCGAKWESPKFPEKYLDTEYYIKKVGKI